MADYLQYWKYVYNEEGLAAGGGANHTAGNQLASVRPGDTIWIATIIDGRLYLAGRIPVAWVGHKRDAERKLHTKNLWNAEYHVIARRGWVEPLRLIDIHGIAKQLRFLSRVDRLPASFSGRSLQELRTLSPDSVRLLGRAWGGKANAKAGGPRRSTTMAASEGTMTEAKHYVRGRSKVLREAAMVRAKGTCEACSRDFSKLLNGMGTRVLQVHHRKQLAATDTPRLTRVDQLAVLCANCHALVHVNRDRVLSVETLRRMLQGGPGRKSRRG